MSNNNALSLYLVQDGEANEIGINAECDGVRSVIVAAMSPESALRIASAYDRGEVAMDNLQWGASVVSAVTMRDEFGEYL
jgi:hypothetical protein